LLKPAPPCQASRFRRLSHFNKEPINKTGTYKEANASAVLKRAFIYKLFGLNFYFNQTGS